MQRPREWRAPDPLPGHRETSRLVLRWWRSEDAPAMLAAIDVDRAALAQFVPWPLGDNRDLAEVFYNVERFRRTREADELPTDYAIGIFDRETGDAIGGTGFHRIDFETSRAEVGYWIRPDRQRQGLATEATAEMLSWGFAPQAEGGWGFRRIVILCAEPNVGSRRVPEKLGLRREMHACRDRWLEGAGWVDTLGFGIGADEWDPVALRAKSGVAPR